ncbi:MAG: DUF4238 domain-containing protein [Endomicrobium sp.]|jgi:hypothetical protein|nr:DUF4238 domain-containing protein [Endomicrobium sp.]
MTKTKNNHYIPQFYISKWKFNDKQVYCPQKENSKIFKPSPRNIFADRIWDDEVENTFTQIENKSWFPTINRILKDKTTDKLSERELRNFFSFAVALKGRKKHIVAKLYETAESNTAKLDNEWIKDGKATKEEIEKLQKYNKKILNHSFLSLFNPDLSKKGSILNPFKRFSFGRKIIQEKDMQYGQFLTSDCPLLMLNEKDEVSLIMIALTPNLLVFGAKGIEIFKTVYNTPINITIKKFNQKIYNDTQSEYIISNKRYILEQFL